MRITSLQIESFVQAINASIGLKKAELRLYGSRLNDEANGGDIDLLLIVSPEQYEAAVKKKAIILVEMKEKIGDQKIDLAVVTKDHIPPDPFIELIYNSSKILHYWEK